MFYTVTFFTVLFLLFIFWDVRKPDNFPPGPRWYPIVGSALQISHLRLKFGMFCKVVDELAKHYLNPYGLYGLKIGKDKLVIVYYSDAINKMTTNEDLDGRPDGLFYRTRTFNSKKGIIFSDEELWQEQRRFILRHLKDFGFSRSGMVNIVQNEASHLLQDLRSRVKQQGGDYAVVPMHDLFSLFILNTLWSMMASKRYDRGSSEVVELLGLFADLIQNIDMIGCLFSHFPLMRFIAPDYSGYTSFVDIHRRMYAFLSREVKNHRRDFMNYDVPRDLMDSYLREMAKPDHSQLFTEEQLLAVCLDMFLAGSETTSKALGFAFLHMIRNPDIQTKARAELDAVIGRERLPEWNDRTDLPYCEAIVCEAVRFFMGHSFGLPHRALRDTRVCGYQIPKDTMVVACFRGMMWNSRDFPNPNKFDPTRFLVNNKLVIPEAYNPFGWGKHRCMGKILGQQNLFLFITTLLQNFRFMPIKGEPMPDEEPLDGATASVKPYMAMVVPR